MTQVIGYIKRLKNGEPTDLAIRHEETLRRLGYDVSTSENGMDLVVQGSQIWKDEIDLTNHETAMTFIKNAIVGEKALLSYSGSFKVKKKDGTERLLPGNFALSFLERVCEDISCLVVKDSPSNPPKESSYGLDDILAD